MSRRLPRLLLLLLLRSCCCYCIAATSVSLLLQLGGLSDPPTECGARLSVEGLRRLLQSLKQYLQQPEAAAEWLAVAGAVADAFSHSAPRALLARAAVTTQALRLSFGLYFSSIETQDLGPSAAAAAEAAHQQQQQKQRQREKQQQQQRHLQQRHQEQPQQPLPQQQQQRKQHRQRDDSPGPSFGHPLDWLLQEGLRSSSSKMPAGTEPLPAEDRQLLLRCLPESICSSSSSSSSSRTPTAVGGHLMAPLRLPFDPQDVAARCVAQLLLIDLLRVS
ncbi:sec7 domain-containing protein, putative [Eimeria tenella]|uniref:Sec7 domain-containing protein, putative n=1 Tax=Eimeria tenella TaxID=5802 RepID=U6L5E7_EIMTE|nr:sec7 domain-containing protein, putative [Eimeria tenella]CDJ43829.1 sec7 domain-containing protein, putative [Eimeria tenella]|eukprot:XP_013234578.1 sec7 domain-containing protein, putative [Eimeria tenella]